MFQVHQLGYTTYLWVENLISGLIHILWAKERSLKLLVLAVILSVGMILASLNSGFVIADHSTIVVPDDYPTIQQAINLANNGDTIFVREGTYCENVIANKTVTLIGQNNQRTIVDGQSREDTFQVNTSNVNIRGFRILGGRDTNALFGGAGITIESVCANIRIENNTFDDNWNGIYLEYCSNITIENNNIKKSYTDGVFVDCCSNITISKNTIAEGDEAIGLVSCSDVLINSNTLVKNNRGIEISGGSWNTVRDNVITHNSFFGVILIDTIRNTLCGNLITNNKYGIRLDGCLNTTVTNCTVAANEVGVLVQGVCAMNTLYHNAFIGNRGAAKMDGFCSGNYWDSGYPAGGNYWSGHIGTDEYQGPNQDQPGADGIGDDPLYVVGGDSDRYPLMKPIFICKHELATSVWVPDMTLVGTTADLEVVMCNLGSANESDVIVQLFIDKNLVDSVEFPQLLAGRHALSAFPSFQPTLRCLR